jgi:hypothetical protein
VEQLIKIIKIIFYEVEKIFPIVIESNLFCLFLALGQLMLYVDGMNAVMNQNEVVQWLYSLIESSVGNQNLSFCYLEIFLFSFDLLLKQV